MSKDHQPHLLNEDGKEVDRIFDDSISFVGDSSKEKYDGESQIIRAGEIEDEKRNLGDESSFTGAASEEKYDGEQQPIRVGEVEESGKKTKKETLTANLQVLGAFFLMFNSWGIANTFGAFQTFYTTILLPHQSPSQISWIGSLQAFLLLIVGGLISGPIFDKGYLREMVFVGTCFSVVGMMLTSVCTKYWQVLLCQGVVMGIGSGCMLLPSVAVMPQYFKKRRAFATGIGAAGSSIGGVIYPIIFHRLQPTIGFGWATRVIAFIMLSTLSVPILVMRAKVFPSTRRPFFDTKILSNIPWLLFSIGAFFGYMGMYIPFYYITDYSIEKGIMSMNLAFYMLTILNTGSIFGRLIPNFFADKVGPLNTVAPCVLLCGIIAFCWLKVDETWKVVVFGFWYGFVSGTFVSMTAPALVTLSPDLGLVGTHMGMSMGFGAFGLLTGNPVAGVLLVKYGWVGLICFCGTCGVLSGSMIVASRLSKAGLMWKVKA